MKKKNIRDTPVIVVPKMDFEDDGYANGDPILVEEVKVVFDK